MCLSFLSFLRGEIMKKLICITAIVIISQFLTACIAFIPPSHRDTVVIIHEPDPVIIPQPIIIEVPAPTHPQPLPPEKPAVIKERKQKETSDGRNQNSERDATERQRNSGERSRR